jgi:hypothetical protein
MVSTEMGRSHAVLSEELSEIFRAQYDANKGQASIKQYRLSLVIMAAQ